MADEHNRAPDDRLPGDEDTPETPSSGPDLTIETGDDRQPPVDEDNTGADDNASENGDSNGDTEDERMNERLERLGGEPAPAISPEEFARLQQSGQIHIDSRGRVRTNRREETDAGMSLRKRRAWYA